jgi:Domain of unknown function (DUF4214)
LPSGFGAARDAFVITLYREILNRQPEPSGLRFWSGLLAARTDPRTVAGAIWRSSEHRTLVRQHIAPSIGLRQAFSDALLSGRQATRMVPSIPTGLLARTSHGRSVRPR